MGTAPLTPRALERRLKRYVRKETQDFLAVGAPGFEAVLLREVAAVANVGSAQVIRGGVEFKGPLETIYQANLHLTTAHRVLWRVADFLAQSYPMLYNKAQKLPWEHYLGFAETVRFSVSSRRSKLNHQSKIAETLLSAVQDVVGPLGLHPQLAEDAPLNLHVRLFHDRCTLSLDTSGGHLHRRGYRDHVGEAPLRETLAAAILKTVDFGRFDVILDPMCGSGTFLLEAARLLRGTPPGSDRAFAFEHFPVFQENLWERLRREAAERTQPVFPKLFGFDKDERVLRAARHNAENAQVAEAIHFAVADARTIPYAALMAGHPNALLLCNPPYGKRLSPIRARKLYSDFSQVLRASPGWTFAILTPERDWLELPVRQAIDFQNGGLDISLLVGQT